MLGTTRSTRGSRPSAKPAAAKVDVTTEVYPYTAGASLIQSALYDRFTEWPDVSNRRRLRARPGTFARILGKYVRDEKLVSLADALRRMTLKPARRLETRAPEMQDRGRIRVGAYADLTVFDPATVVDRATYTNAAVASEGILHVVVNGVRVVREGKLATHGTLQGVRVQIGNPMPGRPIRSPRTPTLKRSVSPG